MKGGVENNLLRLSKQKYMEIAFSTITLDWRYWVLIEINWTAQWF